MVALWQAVNNSYFHQYEKDWAKAEVSFVQSFSKYLVQLTARAAQSVVDNLADSTFH